MDTALEERVRRWKPSDQVKYWCVLLKEAEEAELPRWAAEPQ